MLRRRAEAPDVEPRRLDIRPQVFDQLRWEAT